MSKISDNIKEKLRPIYYWFMDLCFYFKGLFISSKIKDYKSIPIIINNYNRLTFLKKLINSLEVRGYTNIYIIDNNSTFPPLLEYYNDCRYTVFRLNKNVGHLALWETDIYKMFINDFYVYTDPDVVPVDECPADFLNLFLLTLKKFKLAKKVGFSLKIDDLPDHYSRKEDVILWEKSICTKKINDLLYAAQIDTTFALYRPLFKGGAHHYHKTFRTAHPYVARHLPWYIDSSNIDFEEQYYIRNAKTSTHWTVLNESDRKDLRH